MSEKSQDTRTDEQESGPDVHDLDARIEEAAERPTSGDDLSDDEKQEMEKEREERLDPDNRPDNVEIDNSDRDFDPVKGQFTDSDDDPDLGPFADPSEEEG
jgi:hypothetical protein